MSGEQTSLYQSPQSLSLGGSWGCVIDDGEVKCWGTSFEGAAEVPELTNPVAVDTEAGVSCAIHDGGVKCWGQNANANGLLDVPDLINPSEISVGFANACAIDDTGIVCWGEEGSSVVREMPDLENPYNFTFGRLIS